MSAAHGLFARFANPHFVETGTGAGDGLAQALAEGFEDVWSIERSAGRALAATQRFDGDPRVHILQGSSVVRLPAVLCTFHEPATFWLDAHAVPREYEETRGWPCPLRDELEAIFDWTMAPRCNILIDDIKDFATGALGITFHKTVQLLARHGFEVELGLGRTPEHGEAQAEVLIARAFA